MILNSFLLRLIIYENLSFIQMSIVKLVSAMPWRENGFAREVSDADVLIECLSAR